MSEQLKNCIPVLELLVKVKNPKKRKEYFKLFHQCILRAIREICINLLLGNVPLLTTEKARLRKYKTGLRILADPHIPISKKKRLLIKSGGAILSNLLPPTIRRLKDV